MVTIETADPDHAEDICRVGTASWREAYADVLPDEYVAANIRARYDPERIAGQIEENDESDGADGIGNWLVALDDDAVAARDGDASKPGEGVVGAVRDDRPEPGVGEVSGLYVHPDWQSEGVGSRLLETLTERQRDRGVTEQRAYVFADNDAAIGFYEAKGFDPGERFAAATVEGVDPDCEAVRFARSLRVRR